MWMFSFLLVTTISFNQDPPVLFFFTVRFNHLLPHSWSATCFLLWDASVLSSVTVTLDLIAIKPFPLLQEVLLRDGEWLVTASPSLSGHTATILPILYIVQAMSNRKANRTLKERRRGQPVQSHHFIYSYQSPFLVKVECREWHPLTAARP